MTLAQREQPRGRSGETFSKIQRSRQPGATATPTTEILISPRMGLWAPKLWCRPSARRCPMTMQSDHHARGLSDNPGAQLALLIVAVIMLIAIGWFYFQ